ncbi:hypothetical protein [Lacinutrix jangbogonensis]|uniref:hypothetical protein n=1 Tax=Lacinutrix jangbogonensis TaxID=1469557 RepID=UPI00053D29D4|nr:hypothetical protein [Lacinutrix jangbogonensis]
MKNSKNLYLKKISVVMAILLTTVISCERELSEDAVFAEFGSNAEIYTDAPVGLTDQFFTSFDPNQGANTQGFGTDNNEAYLGSSSIRIDVPQPNDPDGGFIGGIFLDRGQGRNLTGYDALTFWAKGSTTAIIEAGFGTDFSEDKFVVGTKNVVLSTDWRKIIIPIPDESKLIQEKGMFLFSAGTQSTGGVGYTFWMDELKFEKLGTIAQPRPSIFNGEDVVQTAFLGAPVPVTGLTETFNLGSGVNQTVNVAPSYFTFKSSDTNIALVSERGVVTIVGIGSAVITASINGVPAEGSLTVNSGGNFDLAPTPTRDPGTVISIYSDHYTNVPVDFYNGFWEPFQTTESADFIANGDNILGYTNFNFVGNQFANPTVDATVKSNLHLNMYIPDNIPANLDFLISVVDFGADGVDGGTDDLRQQIFFNSSDFVADEWSTLEIPLTLANRSHIGLIIYENVNGSPLTDFYLDNIYFYE